MNWRNASRVASGVVPPTKDIVTPESLAADVKKKVHALRDEAKKALAEHDYQYAKDVLDNAIELEANSYKLYRLRSIAHAALGQFSRSAEDADKVITLAPTIMDGYYHKGFALFQIRRYSEAAHSFQEGLKLNPSDLVLQQGFWDAITLVGQSRTNAQQPGVARESSASALEDVMDGIAGEEAREAAHVAMTPHAMPKTPKISSSPSMKNSPWGKVKERGG